MRATAKRLVQAERRAKEKDDDRNGLISSDDLAEAEKTGLLDEANLEIFLTWWAFGGAQHGLTPLQAAEMPAAMRQDFSFILGQITRERKRQEKLEAKRKPMEGNG